MLKIAEYNTKTGKKIDLKELKQFTPLNCKFIKIKGRYGFMDKFSYCMINIENRKLFLGSSCCNPITRNNLLYDLIQAGYVEKVDDK